jgi:hypothetical protein
MGKEKIRRKTKETKHIHGKTYYQIPIYASIKHDATKYDVKIYGHVISVSSDAIDPTVKFVFWKWLLTRFKFLINFNRSICITTVALRSSRTCRLSIPTSLSHFATITS